MPDRRRSFGNCLLSPSIINSRNGNAFRRSASTYMEVRMSKSLASCIFGAALLVPLGVQADDVKHQKKEAEEAQAKADKAQAKADKETAKYDEKSYRRYIKEQNKADKEWSKLEAKEREDYYEWLKKHPH